MRYGFCATPVFTGSYPQDDVKAVAVLADSVIGCEQANASSAFFIIKVLTFTLEEAIENAANREASKAGFGSKQLPLSPLRRLRRGLSGLPRQQKATRPDHQQSHGSLKTLQQSRFTLDTEEKRGFETQNAVEIDLKITNPLPDSKDRQDTGGTISTEMCCNAFTGPEDIKRFALSPEICFYSSGHIGSKSKKVQESNQTPMPKKSLASRRHPISLFMRKRAKSRMRFNGTFQTRLGACQNQSGTAKILRSGAIEENIFSRVNYAICKAGVQLEVSYAKTEIFDSFKLHIVW